MDFTSICRTCFGTKCLNPIFKDGGDHSRYSSAVFITTGLKVTINDGLPQQMCKTCIKLLNDSLRFRKQCEDAEIQLLNLKNRNKDFGTLIKDLKSPVLKRKRKKNSLKDCYIDIKIESDIFEKGDEIPLQKLVKEITDKTLEEVKVETQFIEIEIENKIQKPNTDFINNLIKDDIKESIENSDAPEDYKYDEEFLDLHFETNSEAEAYKLVYVNDGDKAIDNIKDSPIEESLNDVTNTEMPFVILDSKRVTCILCQKVLSRRSIDSHMSKRHPGADTRKVKCDLCDTHILKEKLNRHKIIMHGRDAFRCGSCKTECESKEALIEHAATCNVKKKRRKTKRTELKVECDICHKLMQKASLRLHKEIKHAGMGPVCEHCGRRCGNKFRLSEHLRAKHGYEKFKCAECGFLSASSMAMRNHERRHRGEKPFSCGACGAAFHAAHLLAQHRQSHRTEKLMKCDVCPAAFKANNTLHMHKITCHNAHTYQCSMCPRTYSCRHYAVKHLRNVHRYTGTVGPLRTADRAVPLHADRAAPLALAAVVGEDNK